MGNISKIYTATREYQCQLVCTSQDLFLLRLSSLRLWIFRLQLRLCLCLILLCSLRLGHTENLKEAVARFNQLFGRTSLPSKTKDLLSVFSKVLCKINVVFVATDDAESERRMRLTVG